MRSDQTTPGFPAPISHAFLYRTMSALLFSLAASALAAPDTVTYTYDPNGRLTKADFGGGRSSAYTYDRAGNLLTARTQSPDNTLTVVVSPGAGGRVAGTGISCPGTCVHPFAGTPLVPLSATAAPGWRSLGWGGGASGTASPVTVTMDADKVVTAYFGAASGQTDTDGVPDAEEMGPAGTDPSWDGDGDGVPDFQQPNVVSLHTLTGAYVTLAVPLPLALVSVQTMGNPSPADAPAGVGFPFGFLGFTVTGLAGGGCATATLFLPRTPSLTSYYKFGPTPATPASHWYPFGKSGSTGATIVHETARTLVRLDLCDGQTGDAGPAGDGRVVDPGAVAGPASPQLSLSPGSVAFDPLGAALSATRTVTVSNTGQAPLVVGTVGQGNGLAAPFSITGDSCSGASVPAGSACTITVTFHPTAPGTFADDFAVPSNDPSGPATVTVSGTGLTAAEAAIPAASPLGLLLLSVLVALAGTTVLRRS